MSIDLGNKLVLQPDWNISSGHKQVLITGREPVLTFDPEKVLVATYDFYTKWRAGSTVAMTAQVGATAGNICTVTAPAVQPTKLAEADRDGLRNLGIDCQLNRNAGDDELSLAFT
jgi:hypothetical protein